MRTKVLTAPRVVLALLCAMYFIAYLDRVNMATAAPVIKAELHLTNSQMGLLFASFGAFYTIVHAFGGWVADRFGARRTLFFAALVWAFATIMLGTVTGFVGLIVWRLVLGFGESFNFPTATLAMQRWIPLGKRGFAQGLTHSFSRLANAATPPLIAFLMAWFNGWRGAFVMVGIASLVWATIWFWYFRDDPATHAGVSPDELKAIEKDQPIQRAVKRSIPWRRLIRRMLPVTATYFCYGWTLWVYLNWLPSFFKDGYGLDIKNSALFSSGVFFAGVVGDSLGGYVSDRILKRTGNLLRARRDLIVFGLLGGAFCLIPLFFTKDLTAIALLLSGGFFCLELIIAPMWNIPTDVAPEYSSSATALMSTGSTLAALVSPYAFGLIVDMSGNWMLPFAFSIVLLFIGAALAFTMHPERPFVDEEDMPAPPTRLAFDKASDAAHPI
jgi:MFS family permease